MAENDQCDCSELIWNDEGIFKCKLFDGFETTKIKQDIDDEIIKFLKFLAIRAFKLTGYSIVKKQKPVNNQNSYEPRE